MLRRRRTLVAALLLAALCNACGGGGGGGTAIQPPAAPPTAPPAANAAINVLMLGNSHTVSNNLPDMLAAMLQAGRPGKTVSVIAAPGILFLDERLRDSETLRLFNSRKWSAVVFQAQQYSQSGQFTYSTEEAVEWVHMTREQATLPVMFPEWPRRGIDETQRIYDIHVGIAKRQPACVAPVPQAWDLAALRIPGVVLHAADGNHSAPPGAFLAALVLYATMTGNAPQDLPALAITGVDSAAQARLRAVADEQMRQINGRQWCPGDPLL